MEGGAPDTRGHLHTSSSSSSSSSDSDSGDRLMQEVVRRLGGKRVIQRVLVANNGLAAVKGIRSMRKWVFEQTGQLRAVRMIVMATPEDLSAGAQYIKLADEVLEVPGGKNLNNFANVELIVNLARRSAADAVWAGWGHASENPRLPESLEAQGIVFLGPPARPMRLLGDKIISTILAQSAGVQTVPWSGSGLLVKGDPGAEVDVSDEVIRQACLYTAEEAVDSCVRIGFPVVLKASEGGGGKGIRKVTKVEDVARAFQQVSTEVPGSPIFAMKVCSSSRHIEVQVVADEDGNTISLFTRDCSIQRRHQKIIEEGPALFPPAEVTRQMQLAAVNLTKMVGYRGAGTVEYLFNHEQGVAFLELNPRLQVEHPVTEGITGVNIPALQLMIGMGIPLTNIPEVQALYVGGSLEDAVPLVPPSGHVIAARITAEDADEGFLPTSGTVKELFFCSLPDVWGYFSIGNGSSIHQFADSQFGHIFARGRDREEARRNLVVALQELLVRGQIRTPTEYLVRLLQGEAFKEDTFTTEWLDSLISGQKKDSRPLLLVPVVCRATQLLYQHFEEARQQFICQVQQGHEPGKDLLSTCIPLEISYHGMLFKMTGYRCGRDSFFLVMNNSMARVSVRVGDDGGLVVLMEGHNHVVYTQEEGSGTRLIIDHQSFVFPAAVDPSVLKAEVAGKLMRYLVREGDAVEIGTPVAELEVMKMCLTVVARFPGRIHLLLPEKTALDVGDTMARVEVDTSSEASSRGVCVAEPFQDPFPASMQWTSESFFGKTSFSRCRASVDFLQGVLSGDCYPDFLFQELLDAAMESLPLVANPTTAFEAFAEMFSSFEKLLPAKKLHEVAEVVRKSSEGTVRVRTGGSIQRETAPLTIHLKPAFPFSKVDSLLRSLDEDLPELQLWWDSFRHRYDPDFSADGGPLAGVILTLLQQYLGIERPFQSFSDLSSVRERYSNLEELYGACCSHYMIQSKNQVILALLNLAAENRLCGTPPDLEYPLQTPITPSELSPGPSSSPGPLSEGGSPSFSMGPISSALEELARLPSAQKNFGYGEVPLLAKRLLWTSRLPSFVQRRQAIESLLQRTHEQWVNGDDEALTALVNKSFFTIDVLLSLLFHEDMSIRLCALNLYIRRAYQTLSVQDVQLLDDMMEKDIPIAQFHFLAPSSEAVSATVNSLDAELGSPRGVSMRPASSMEDLASLLADNLMGTGFVAVIPAQSALTRDHIEEIFSVVASRMAHVFTIEASKTANVMYLVCGGLLEDQEEVNDEEIQSMLSVHLKPLIPQLRRFGFRRFTFVSMRKDELPRFFTYRLRLDFQEDSIYRHIEPAMSYQLELKRLANYNIRLVPNNLNQQFHIYFGEAKPEVTGRVNSLIPDQRYFVRAVVLQNDVFSMFNPQEFQVREGEALLVEILNALDVAVEGGPVSHHNHIFINILPEIPIAPPLVAKLVRMIAMDHGPRLWELHVREVELRVTIREKYSSKHDSVSLPSGGRPSRDSDLRSMTFRVVASNFSRYDLQVAMYIELDRPREEGGPVLRRLDGMEEGYNFLDLINKSDPVNNKPVFSRYPILSSLDRKRLMAQQQDTSYVYDFPVIFALAAQVKWKQSRVPLPEDFSTSKPVQFSELVLNGNGQLVECCRESGENTIGMVAWRVKLRTPEFPGGRTIYVLANDITVLSGSFAVQEDLLFQKVSELARSEGAPRIFLSANSGARLGLDDLLKRSFNVKWKDREDLSRGFEYLYLTTKQMESMPQDVVSGHWVEDPELGESVFVLDGIIGAQDEIGVENLCGSGLIAGETSRAYREGFTLSYVTGRTVGIGSYLVRLGQRCIQNSSHPIILTGAPALNKVLGREVYRSNNEIGGTRIMFGNGVTHLVVSDDFQGVLEILQWLSFVPERAGGPPSVLPISDPVDRPVDFCPEMEAEGPIDVRWLLAGKTMENGTWCSGFFDRGSFKEYCAGWARNIVGGRARLGGRAVGVIAVETRMVHSWEPADPADPLSTERNVQKAGQVWFPDSAFKTAQFIQDFNHGEELPLFIFANWRGFSGGRRDMFDEILKFGSMIVDNLVDYQHPIFVYIPPMAELRGGAWVVVDSSINKSRIEMYSDPTARGGILEPEGVVEIKFRDRDLIHTMHRLDPTCIRLRERIQAAGGNPPSDVVESLRQQEKVLLPVYRRVAVSFADLHDTPIRMKAKGAIRDIVDWKHSRSFFHWRLQKRLLLQKFCRKSLQSEELIHSLVCQLCSMEESTSDQEFCSQVAQHQQEIDTMLQDWKSQGVLNQLETIKLQHPDVFLHFLRAQATTSVTSSPYSASSSEAL